MIDQEQAQAYWRWIDASQSASRSDRLCAEFGLADEFSVVGEVDLLMADAATDRLELLMTLASLATTELRLAHVALELLDDTPTGVLEELGLANDDLPGVNQLRRALDLRQRLLG